MWSSGARWRSGLTGTPVMSSGGSCCLRNCTATTRHVCRSGVLTAIRVMPHHCRSQSVLYTQSINIVSHRLLAEHCCSNKVRCCCPRLVGPPGYGGDSHHGRSYHTHDGGSLTLHYCTLAHTGRRHCRVRQCTSGLGESPVVSFSQHCCGPLKHLLTVLGRRRNSCLHLTHRCSAWNIASSAIALTAWMLVIIIVV